ncbi:mechanosensitive ion channel family protein [Microvirga sp. STR05]|uniref:Mechanosensitive ion channel family protein n=1 Tax=Hymenobacter duratus TaxID=2771356 RepID=A0ABR8JH19_9BACT|nr:mechanosensitive ion channel family protein [Hymenobacter duratus]MBD2716136.1 mechanosensitive ion channel family protein [Hymenobacter duratus]MBR7951050.1 mechanosensitive ion channel family protein [Microvirga sp. STR05]
MLQDLNRVLSTYWQQFLYVLPKLALALLLLIVAIFVSNRLSTLIGGRLRRRSHDPLLADFLTRISKWVFVLIGLLLAMQIVGLSGVVSGLLAGAGLSAFIVGFAFKDIAENFLAGVILAFNRPFHINDTVQIKDQIGHVEALNLRTTLMRTFDGKHVFLPNSLVLKEPLINFTRDGNLRQDFLASVDYGDNGNPGQVQQLLLEFLRTHPDVQHETAHPPYIILEKTNGTTADLRVYFWTSSDEYRRGTLQIKSDLMQKVKVMLQEKGYPAPNLAQ